MTQVPPSAHLKPPPKRHSDAQWLEDEDCLFDSKEFKHYASQIEQIIKVKRKWPDGREKGWSISEIHLLLGDDANPRWTLMAIEWITGVHEDVGSQTRYRVVI